MDRLNDTKISEGNPHWMLEDDLYANATVRGSYSPIHFVVRLDPRLRAALDRVGTRVVKGGELDPETTLSFSTYFHETIHWWQHIGSTAGLMLTFAFPAQFHVNLRHLRDSLTDPGPRKSLKAHLMQHGENLSPKAQTTLNTILNNWHDVEFNRRLIMDPMNSHAVVNSPFF
ncbi:MAG: hypothetical protein M5U26_13205 [Planctomycetota bacterium]|nr:hypothetical protein [Planctomycetota bacterium]